MKKTSDKQLIRELIVVLVIKLILLYAIWHCFFDQPSTVDSPDEISERMLSRSE